MANSLTGLTGNLAESLHTKVNAKIVSPAFENMTDKDGLLTFKSVNCNKSHEEKFYEDTYLKTCISSPTETLTNSSSCCREIFINVSTLISRKDSMKRHYPQRRNSTAP